MGEEEEGVELFVEIEEAIEIALGRVGWWIGLTPPFGFGGSSSSLI